MRFGDMDDLLARISSSLDDAGRPLALLLGAGSSAGVVPGVDQTVNYIRRSLDADESIRLDGRLAGITDGAERYQAAFDFLAKRKPPRFRDRIVQACALRAFDRTIGNRSELSVENFARYEAEVDAWNLPEGVEAIGRIWSGLPDQMRGPIITTNFDPLCEVAIRKSGHHPIVKVIDEDGAFWADLRNNQAPQVVHIHGYWRDSATLHLAAELSLDRPQLEGSLRAVLKSHTLIVAGYGGWRDAIGLTISRLVDEQSAKDFDILWTVYGDAKSEESRLRENDVLASLARAPGGVGFYSGIDSNVFFPELEKRLATFLSFRSIPRSYAARGSLIGWSTVDPDAHDGGGVVDHASAALTFFDGRLPTWRDARNPYIPRRDATSSLSREMSSSLSRPGSSLSIIVGAAGEGKTTAALQIATAIAKSHPDIAVMFNGEESLRGSADVLSLPADKTYVLVVDDAFLSSDALKATARDINEAGDRRIHIIGVSRDTDWRSTGGFSFPWSKYLPTRVHKLNGLSRLDATAIVNAWEKIGPAALGSLSSFTDTESRVQALEEAARSEENASGSLLGALLKTRFAGNNLREHVRELLFRLDEIRVETSAGTGDVTLRDAFFAIALPHANGLLSMNPTVLGSVLGVDEFQLHGMVLLPLGDEAAASFNAESVLIRHRVIAQAALDLAPEIGVDLKAVTERLVDAGVELVDKLGANTVAKEFAYLSQHLGDPALRVVAARRAASLRPGRLSYRTSLARALRKCGDVSGAAVVGAESIRVLPGALDGSTGGRPVFTEWGVAEGNLGNWARNCALGGAALQDLPILGRLGNHQTGPALSCLALALRQLIKRRDDLVFRHGLSGLLFLADRVPMDAQQRSWLREADELLGGSAFPSPSSAGEATRLLADACRASLAYLEGPFPDGMIPLRFTFQQLAASVERF